jgi:hypothetical protein
MKTIFYFLFFSIVFFGGKLHAQVENIIVEKYYISDDSDAADTTGGKLKQGSITYRVFVDLAPHYKLKKIYGDAKHTLKIISDSVFFNNTDRPMTFGYNCSKSWLKDNTVALDTWLTLGQAIKSTTKNYFGVLKSEDGNGSIIGGANHNGGLLVNNDPSAGIPLTTSDGLDTMSFNPTNWFDYGIRDLISQKDSSIFGSLVPGIQFVSNSAALVNDGVMGINPDSNKVLVAQLTTQGKISFELNLEIIDTNGTLINIVAGGPTHSTPQHLNDTILSPYLKYPPVCGCKDPNFLEYSANYACSISDSCKTHIVFGCMDTLACNYDPNANFNVPLLCCYPGYCNDRNLSVVCPELSEGRFSLYPNPVQDAMTFEVSSPENTDTKYAIYDSQGKLISEENVSITSGTSLIAIDVSNLESGLYMFRFFVGGHSQNKMFFKNN